MPLTKDELRSLLSDIENERVERTLSTDNTKKMSEAICAFANDIRGTGKPGYYIIGADDSGNLDGQTFSDEQLRSYGGIRNDGTILPPPAIMVYKEVFQDGELAIVEVQPSYDTPVRYKGVIWIRVGARKAEANSEEERILTEKSQIHSPTFDSRPCLESSVDDIDINLFKSTYLPKAVAPTTLAKDKRTAIQQMASLRLFDTRYNCPTFAGILLLCERPEYFLPGAYIQYVKFAGPTRASKVLKEVRISGNLISMLKDLEYLIKYSIENKRPEFVSILREEERINYPWEALRELAMNAVMHRAYNGNNSPIKIYEYNDRIEIDNPGNLYGKVNPTNFPYETDYRNPNIAEIMRNLGYVNRFGSGIDTVSMLLKENGNKAPEFILSDYTTFKVVIWNADFEEAKSDNNESGTIAEQSGTIVERSGTIVERSGTIAEQYGTIAERSGTIAEQSGTIADDTVQSSDIQQLVLDIIRKDKRISVKQLSKMFNRTKTSMFRIVEQLKTEGKLRRIGSEKTGTWEVID